MIVVVMCANNSTREYPFLWWCQSRAMSNQGIGTKTAVVFVSRFVQMQGRLHSPHFAKRTAQFFALIQHQSLPNNVLVTGREVLYKWWLVRDFLFACLFHLFLEFGLQNVGFDLILEMAVVVLLVPFAMINLIVLLVLFFHFVFYICFA